jgi:two-component system response regulator HydG
MRGRILVVDDEVNTAGLLAESLLQRGYSAEGVSSAYACLDRLERSNVDVVLTDVMMPEMSGIELCGQLRERHPEVLPIVVTGRYGTDVAIAAMRAGAYDYITKPVKIGALELALGRALAHLSVQHELERLRQLPIDYPDAGITGTSSAIRDTLDLVRRVSRSDATVLVTGESGTGKERIARGIHQLSERRDEPFVAINCGAMPAGLLESELFGHVRGAFTDAAADRPGLFVQAGRGTILLDEVGDMPLEMQAKLLRVLQQRSLRPVGSDQEQPFHARVLAATNRNLEEEVAARRFREDLFHRINVVNIQVPALRERHDDILPIAYRILRRCASRTRKPVHGITPPTASMLLAYDWPGNVRELENCIERAVALCRLDQITVDDLPDKIHLACNSRFVVPVGMADGLPTLSEVRHRYMRKVLAMTRGNKSLASRILGIDRRTITHRLTTDPPAIEEIEESED